MQLSYYLIGTRCNFQVKEKQDFMELTVESTEVFLSWKWTKFSWQNRTVCLASNAINEQINAEKGKAKL